MPASMPLKAIGLCLAGAIMALGVLYEPVAPPADLYSATIKVAAGVSMVAGSLFLSHTIGRTFLLGGGRGAFKALYLASLSSAGAGISEAASGLAAVNVLLSLFLASLAFAGAGILVLHFSMGGA